MPRSSSSSTEPAGRTAVGVAHCDFVESLLRDEPGLLEFVEIPFELLLKNPSVSQVGDVTPVVLHCASLSMAGNVPPSDETVARLDHWAARFGTPWIGEHLAFIEAAPPDAGGVRAPMPGPSPRPGPGFPVGYTVSPQYSAAVLDRVVTAHARWEARLGRTILLENGPLIFEMPGSEMSQFEFLRALVTRVGRPCLLLDLSHLLLSCRNLGLAAEATLDQLPLDAVVEVHVSGIREHASLWWDDHARPAEPAIFDLLARLLSRARPRAITFEYNWDARFPRDLLRRHIAAARELAAHA